VSNYCWLGSKSPTGRRGYEMSHLTKILDIKLSEILIHYPRENISGIS